MILRTTCFFWLKIRVGHSAFLPPAPKAMVPLSAAAMRGVERACSAENRDCVAAKQYYDDWVRGLSGLVRAFDGLEAVAEHLPGMSSGEVYI